MAEVKNNPKDFRKDQNNNLNNFVVITVLVPLYNEEESLEILTTEVVKNLKDLVNDNYEVIFINDGSKDNSLDVIKSLCDKNKNLKYISFRRNYGKSAALSVGFAKAKGKLIITMDADLQDDPNEFRNLWNKLKEGYDLVTGWKKKRHDPIHKTAPSKLFNFVTSKVSGLKLHDYNCGLKIYKREVVKSLDVYGEMHRYLPVMAHWNGFKVAELPVIHHPRQFGVSKFGASRFIKGFLDLITLVFNYKFLKRPLHFFGTIGFLFTFIGFMIDLVLSIEWALGKTSLSQRPLIFFGMGLIIVGVQFISIGLLGELMVKNNKNRDNYNIKESNV
ncbi:MAG: glycosyltransferase family 2 protein [Candidatus Kapaibacteriota bacterium]|jgi:glycosyltransferase involved in cell wall biosynthesis